MGAFRPTALVLRSALTACVHVREASFSEWRSKPGYAEESMRRLATGNEIFKLYDAYEVRSRPRPPGGRARHPIARGPAGPPRRRGTVIVNLVTTQNERETLIGMKKE